jgi:hypothetical protein
MKGFSMNLIEYLATNQGVSEYILRQAEKVKDVGKLYEAIEAILPEHIETSAEELAEFVTVSKGKVVPFNTSTPFGNDNEEGEATDLSDALQEFLALSEEERDKRSKELLKQAAYLVSCMIHAKAVKGRLPKDEANALKIIKDVLKS